MMTLTFKKEFEIISQLWSTYISTYNLFHEELWVARFIFDNRAGQIQIGDKEYLIKSKRKYFFLETLEILDGQILIGAVKKGSGLFQTRQLSYLCKSYFVNEAGRLEDLTLRKNRYVLKGDNKQVWYELQQEEINTNTWKHFEGKIQGENLDLFLSVLGLLHLETVLRSLDNSS